MVIWKDIVGFENLYKVSTTGKIKSLGKGKSTNTKNKEVRILKTTLSKTGYEKAKLFKDGKRYYFTVHRLVANTFLTYKDGKNEVNHKDGNKSNNNLNNLEWVSPSENQKHAYKIGLQKAIMGADNFQSKKIRQLSLNGKQIKIFNSIGEIKRELGFNSFGIIKCCKKEKKYNTAYKYKWEYV
jgi:hypothetical protein